MAIFEAESSEKLWAVFQDEEYHKLVVPDEEKFLDKECADWDSFFSWTDIF